MASQINHVAIMSESFAMVAQFYQAVFGFQPPPKQTNFGAITVGDGYTGVNINPRRPGRPARLDHFGIQVDDIDAVLDTFKSKHPMIHVLKRPANRPFAGLTTHDPDGNIFDLSQIRMENRSEIYKTTEQAGGWSQDRVITHFGIRTLNPEKIAEFYVDVLGLSLANRSEGDPNYYVTDGRMTLTLMQWDIMDYDGFGIVGAGPNHIGIKVENLKAFKAHVEDIAGKNPWLAPKEISMGPEGAKSREMFAASVPYARHQMADNNCVLLAIHE
jgi:catechol 2,3-dioxygenase-like lactoylglutathione lyase family enzyme